MHTKLSSQESSYWFHCQLSPSKSQLAVAALSTYTMQQATGLNGFTFVTMAQTPIKRRGQMSEV